MAPAGGAFEAGSAEDEDVEPAVVVVIEEGAAAAHGLDDIVLFGNSPVDRWREEPGGLGDIGEVGVEGKTGRFGSRRRFDVTRAHSLGAKAQRGQLYQETARWFHEQEMRSALSITGGLSAVNS